MMRVAPIDHHLWYDRRSYQICKGKYIKLYVICIKRYVICIKLYVKYIKLYVICIVKNYVKPNLMKISLV